VRSPLGRLLARASRPPVRPGTTAAASSVAAELEKPAPAGSEPGVAPPLSRTAGGAAAASTAVLPPPPAVAARPTTGVAAAPETARPHNAKPRAAARRPAAPEPAGPDPAPVKRGTSEPFRPSGLQRVGLEAASVAKPAATTPQTMRAEAHATPSIEAHLERKPPPRASFEDLLSPVAERAEGGFEAHDEEQRRPAKLLATPAERPRRGHDAPAVTPPARAGAAVRHAVAPPESPRHVPATLPAPVATGDAAPTVVIDQIHVITPPAPAPAPDPFASLAAQRTGSSLHGAH
jgi:hypothetical protein